MNFKDRQTDGLTDIRADRPVYLSADGRADGRMDGRMDRRTDDGRTDGQTDGRPTD